MRGATYNINDPRTTSVVTVSFTIMLFSGLGGVHLAVLLTLHFFVLMWILEVFWINCFFTCFAVSVIILHVSLSSLLFYSSTGICNQHILHFFYSFTIFVSCSEPEVRFLTQTTYLWYVNTSDTGTYLKWEGSVLLHVTDIIISFSCDNHNLNI